MSDTPPTRHGAPADTTAGSYGSGRPDRREGQPTGPVPAFDRRAKILPMISPSVVRGTFRASEGILLALLGMAIAFAYVGEDIADAPVLYASLIVALPVVYVIASDFSRLYRLALLQTQWGTIPSACATWSVIFGLSLVAIVLFKESESLSRVWLASWFLAGLVGIALTRQFAHRLIGHWAEEGRLQQNVVLVGGGQTGQRLIEALRATDMNYINICGIFDDRSGDRAPDEVDGVPKLGSFDELVRFARSNRVDMLLVALPMMAEQRMLSVLEKLWVLPVDIRLSALDNRIRFDSGTYSYVGNVPFFNIYKKPLADWDYVLKAVSDRLIAGAMLLATLPVFLLAAIAIKLDSKGPVFFKQRRYGFNNELIEVYKFRTLSHEKQDANAEKLVTADDDRVTRVGRFLRRSSLDELPQLLTVLKGDMSMVGPRPHAVLAKAGDKLYGDVVDGYFARHRVKPGLTGWAQINGWRGETDTDEKIRRRTEYDLYYIDNWSLLFDLYIILRTPWALLKGENAY
ncbi:MAG: undecaprenyl-phosphate glucose phosphotransferase [Parvibaculaceae bacterium]